MEQYKKIPALLMRGGTSKGAYILLKDLPSDPELRDKVILSMYGSPDARQINGIGGADPLTSKVAIVSPSQRKDADVDYTFGYVGIEAPKVDYEGNCGNMSSGVGPFAIMKHLVPAKSPFTTVRVFNTNTNKIIEIIVPVQDGTVISEGDYAIAGVPGTGAKISLNFPNSAGAKTGKLLSTGNVVDKIRLKNGNVVRVSLVDAANPCIFVKASDVGLTGKELPKETESNPYILDIMEDIRTTGAVMMKMASTKEDASPAVPKVAIVAPPDDYPTSDGTIIRKSDCDLIARTKALAVMHKTYAITGGICLATAACIEGTVVNEIIDSVIAHKGIVRIGHPSGVLEIYVEMKKNKNGWNLARAGVTRTVKPIMDGFIYVPSAIFSE